MSGEDGGNTNGTGPLSWRDVYKAVGDSEERLLRAFDDLRATVTGSTLDHETRLRRIESYMEAVPNEERVKLVGRVSVLEQKVNFFTNREEGFKLAGKLASIAFHILISIVSVAGTILMLQAAGAIN